MLKSVTANAEKRELTIVLELEPPTPSSTGKSLTVASTRGNKATTCVVQGKPVIVGVNAYIQR